MRLDRRDVVRHRLVQRIVDAYGAAQEREHMIEVEARGGADQGRSSRAWCGRVAGSGSSARRWG